MTKAMPSLQQAMQQMQHAFVQFGKSYGKTALFQAMYGGAMYGEEEERLVVPDELGYLYGYRTWIVEQAFQLPALKKYTGDFDMSERIEPIMVFALRSMGFSHYWRSKEQVATCMSRGRGEHSAPQSYCRCGLYAVYDIQHLPRSGHHLTVVGKVRAWGNIIEGTRGFRAQHMEIVSFHPMRPADLSDTKLLGSQYNVEVGGEAQFLPPLNLPY